MPHGGELSIQTRVLPYGPLEEPSTSGSLRSECVALRVVDTGTGMGPELEARAFDPFVTTKPGTGSGLGPSSVRDIVEEAGGGIGLRSEPGRGTWVEARLPCRSQRESGLRLRPLREGNLDRDLRGHAGTPSAAGTPPSLELKRYDAPMLLVVEDDQASREAYAELLSLEGFRVLTVDSAAGALALFRQHASEIGAVLSDFNLCDVDGAALGRDLREVRIDVPILYVTGLVPDEPVLRRALAEPETKTLTKPVNVPTLIATLRQMLAKGIEPRPPVRSPLRPIVGSAELGQPRAQSGPASQPNLPADRLRRR
jgi:CheY-like chemotaxis protein